MLCDLLERNQLAVMRSIIRKHPGTPTGKQQSQRSRRHLSKSTYERQENLLRRNLNIDQGQNDRSVRGVGRFPRSLVRRRRDQPGCC